MSHAAPALLNPITAIPGLVYKQEQDQKNATNALINQQKDEEDKAAADVKARKEEDDKRRALLGQFAQNSLMAGFTRSSNYGGTLLTSGGSGGQSTILGG